jgi:methyltransferase (TIGR00027 family)
MENGRASTTAQTAAALRAHHYLVTNKEPVLSDNLAMPFADMSSQSVSAFIDGMTDHFATLGTRDAAEALVRHITLCVCARSRITEDRLAASLERGMRQLVILGAGLDSMAFRRQDLTADLQIFEVDHPSTQAWKRDRLTALGVTIPENLRFVPFDFEHQTMAEALDAGGVRSDEMTFFTWMGVQPYLTDDAVMSTLDVVSAFPSGSELSLDVMTPPDARQQQDLSESMQQMMALVADQGEPFKSIYAPEEFRDRLQQRGFTDLDIVTYHDWFDRNSDLFERRFSTNVGPCVQVCATVV